MHPSLRIGRLLAALLVAALGLPFPAYAQKTDVITLVNGDEITGEIKEVSLGKLDYSTDDAGRLSIEWVKVQRVTSVHYFEVEMSSGLKYFGQLKSAAEDGSVVVELGRADTLAINRIVRIVPLNSRFIDRLKAYLDVGFSLAKANKATTVNVNTEVDYRGSKWGAGISASSYFQKQEDADKSTRNNITLTMQRFLPKRWQAVALAKAEQNDELGLLLRGSTGGGVGFVAKQSNRSEFELASGLIVTRERFALTDTTAGASPDTLKNNIEGMLGASWSVFRFDSPKLDFSTSLVTYPSISSLGRVRGEGNIRVKYEVFKDFYIGLNFTDTFDSKPPDEAASRNDFVTSVTVGWSYRR
ncbi:MAG: hypothetical protein AMS20_16575 [Gemmatimonas sp. SG8_28]|nr:MAG: hypothetical protein AMS20_16575 [Gemmatimonas sp. SG8_28]